MELMKRRRSIRKYQDKQITRADLEAIIQAGTYAPNAGGGQRSMIVGIRHAGLVEEIGKRNLARFDRSNLAGSYVSREQPSNIDDPTIRNGFYGEAGAAMLPKWGIPDHYIARCFVCLGYVDGDYPGEKPRRAERSKIVEE